MKTYSVDGLEFSKEEVMKVIKDMSSLLQTKREMILADNWNKQTLVEQVKRDQARITQLQALLN
jgi:hypothetical protein